MMGAIKVVTSRWLVSGVTHLRRQKLRHLQVRLTIFYCDCDMDLGGGVCPVRQHSSVPHSMPYLIPVMFLDKNFGLCSSQIQIAVTGFLS